MSPDRHYAQEIDELEPDQSYADHQIDEVSRRMDEAIHELVASAQRFSKELDSVSL